MQNCIAEFVAYPRVFDGTLYREGYVRLTEEPQTVDLRLTCTALSGSLVILFGLQTIRLNSDWFDESHSIEKRTNILRDTHSREEPTTRRQYVRTSLRIASRNRCL